MMTFFFCRKQKIPPPEDEGICMMLYFYSVFKLMTSLVSNCSKLSYMIFDAGHGSGRKPRGN